MRSLDLESPEVEHRTIRAWEIHMGSNIGDPSAFRDRLSGDSLPEEMARTARRRWRHSALNVNGHTITHGALDHSAARAAKGIGRLGAGPNNTVMLLADVGLPEIAAYLGVLRVGATAVLASPLLTPSELEGLAEVSNARWVLGSGKALAACQSMSAGPAELVGLRQEDRPTASVLLDEVADGEIPVTPIDPNSTAILAFTSGSTGHPKPTPLSHANLLSSIRGAMWAWRWSEHDHLVHALPISHQHGLSGIHATLLAGSRATLLGRLDAEALLATVEEDAATIHFGVPATHQRLLERLGRDAVGLSGLRLAISGSGPLPVDLASRYRETVGKGLLERYGTTESGLNVSNPYVGPLLPGCVGLPLPGIEVATVDEDGRLIDEDRVGRILIRGPQVFEGYHGIADASQPFFDRWFATGDVGTVDPESGYLRIVGRTKDVIISGGMNVYPREVEDAIRHLPSISDVAVIGVESSRWGEEVVAVISPGYVETSAVMATLAERLAPYKKPKRVIAVPEIPRTQVGKLDREQLIEKISPREPKNRLVE